MSEVLVAARELEREYRVGPETVRVLRGVTLAVGAGERGERDTCSATRTKYMISN